MCYLRMARTSNDVASMGIQPSVICRLPGGERGCRLILFGRAYQFSVRVRALRSDVTIDVSADPLDGPLHCIVPLCSGSDCDAHWSRALPCARSSRSVFFDSYWAQEQAEQQQDED